MPLIVMPRRKDNPHLVQSPNMVLDKASPSPITPAVTGITFPSPVETSMYPARSGHVPIPANISLHPSTISDDSIEPITPPDYESLDQLWNNLRQEKERKMAKEPPKVQSLGGTSAGMPLLNPHPVPKPSVDQHKYVSTFREAPDGRTMIATFSLPGLSKTDVHVSFQRNRIVVTWAVVHVSQRPEEEGGVITERKEETHTRTIPLPEGTKFEEVRAAMNKESLILKYPKMRTAVNILEE